MFEATNGGGFLTQSQGPGDLTLTAITRFMEKDSEVLFFSVELGTPTGSIRQRSTASGMNERLPYPMQLGSGTFDFLPGVTYLGQTDDWS